jgi:dipeptidyl aminopeptidase/acylaminoacyl peptidase
MPLTVRCPKCNKALRIKEDLQGKRIRCPACKEAFVVDAAVIEPEVAALVEEAPPAQPPHREQVSQRPGGPRDEEDVSPRPARERQRDRDEEEQRPRKKKSGGLVLVLVLGGLGGLLLVCVGAPVALWMLGSTGPRTNITDSGPGPGGVLGGPAGRTPVGRTPVEEINLPARDEAEEKRLADDRDKKRLTYLTQEQQVIKNLVQGDANSRAEGLAIAQLKNRGSSAAMFVTFSPDGQWLAVMATGQQGLATTNVELWDLRTGKVRHELAGHTGNHHEMVFSPDSRTLATAWNKTTIRLWDVQTGKPRRDLAGLTTEVRRLAFSPDGQMVAAGAKSDGDGSGMVKFWNAADGSEISRIPPQSSFVPLLAFRPAGRVLAMTDSRDQVRLWEVGTGKLYFMRPGVRHCQTSGS